MKLKRLLVLISVLSLFTLSLSASYYVSNELGQKKGSASSLSESEWILSSSGNTETLYRSGEEVSRKVTSSSGWTKTTSDGKEEKVFLNSDGNIERRVITESDGTTEEYNYLYSGTLLTGYNYSLNGELVEKVEYTTTSSGSLLYYRVKDEGIYISDDYFVYEGGDSVSLGAFSFSDDVISEATEDGGYIEKEDGKEREYDSSGRLIRETTDTSETSYTYLSDGTLSEKKEEKEDGVYVTTYTDGEVLSRYSTDGEKISERRLLEDGTTEEKRFVNGEAKYVFIYDTDGRRIKEARAL